MSPLARDERLKRVESCLKTLSLGTYPDIPEEGARARHRLARRLLTAGVDPELRKEEVRHCWIIEDSRGIEALAPASEVSP
jgi:hypothetical protein